MKITELNNYLTEYASCDEIKSLLINGKWGIGKTYSVTQFLKNISSNKKIKARYCSLFGCPNIDTLHQQLYAKFHSNKVRGLKALSYVPLALNLTSTIGFETGIDTAKIANDIEANQINKSIKVNKKLCLVIFDDLERMANNSTIKMEELLGYFNRLRSENIKIIVLCNEEEIKGENLKVFNNFKEKVFDRSINIEGYNNAVIEEFFGDDYKYLKNETLDLIDNNLRTAYKISIFFDEAKVFLKNNKIEVDAEDLLFICANIITEFFTKTLSEKYKSDLDERQKSGDSYTAVFTRLELEKEFTDEFIINAICRNIANYSLTVNNTIISSLYRLFAYLDKSPVNKVKEQTNTFNEDKIFFLSDENKIKYIEDKMKALNDTNSRIPNHEIIKEIVSWLTYCPLYFNDETLKNVVNRILELSESKTNKDIVAVFLNHEYIIDKKTTLLANFYKLLKAMNKQKQEYHCIEYFKTIINNLNNYSGQLSQLQHFLTQNSLAVPKELIDLIVDNNFFIPDLSKDINVNLWDFCHSMCRFVVDKMPNYKKELRNYLLSLKETTNSKCLSERAQSLIDYAIDNVQQN